jgi:N-methylhydantoinase B
MKDLDAVSLGIMWDRLIAITNEVVRALVRTSFSTNVRESYDLSVMLFDAQARLIAQGDYSAPSFTGTGPPTARHMLAKYPPETLRPGDVICTNDPWLGTGHLYDITVMRPIFRGDNLVGYSASVTHLPDIGGLGFSATAREVYEEGLRLPICKLVSEGVPNHELLDLIATNVRVPEQTLGDLHANIACNEVGNRLLVEFMDEYRIDDLRPIADAIVENSENAMRRKIREMPDGTYENSFQIEAQEEPLTLACRIDVKDETIAVDFAGTSPTIRMGINVPLTYSTAYVTYALKCVTVPHMPNNMGFVLPIRVSGPENCILNAQPPFPTGGRHVVGHYVAWLIFGALEKVVPEEVQAESGMLTLMNVQGTHRDGRGVSSIYFASGGFGALAGTDGASTTPSPTNMTGTPVEVWENLTSTTIEKKALLTDSGGAGKARGGLGQEIVFRNDSGHDLTISCFGGRTEYPARGMWGGGPGALRQYRLNGEPVHPKGRYILGPGDVIALIEPGGGGFGDPRERDPGKVLQDVLEGAVSQEAAARDYGVVVSGDTARRPTAGS